MMATVPRFTSGSGLRKFQANRFLFDRVYKSSWCPNKGDTNLDTTDRNFSTVP